MALYHDIKQFSPATRKVLFVQWLTSVGYFSVIPFLVVYLVRHLSFPAEFATLQLSLFLAGQYGATFLGGLLSDRYSPNLTMKGGLLLQILCYLIFLSNVSAPALICVLSASIGISKGLFTPAAKALVAKVSAGSNRILLFSFRSTVNNIGVALGSAIGGFFMDENSSLFFGIAAASQLLALALLFSLPAVSSASRAGDPAPGTPAGALRSLFTNPPFLFCCVLYASFNFLYMQLESAFPLFATQNWGPWAVSALFITNAAIVILLQVLVNVWLNKWLSHWLAMGIGFIAFSFSFYALGMVTGLSAFVILIAIYTLGEITIDPTIDAVTSENVIPARLGTAFGVLGVAGLVGGVTGNTLAGHYLGGISHPQGLWAICLIVAVTGLVLTLLLSLRKSGVSQTQAN